MNHSFRIPKISNSISKSKNIFAGSNIKLNYKIRINNCSIIKKYNKQSKFQFDNKNTFKNVKLNFKSKKLTSISKNVRKQRSLPIWIRKYTKFESYITSTQLLAASVKATTAKHYRAAGNLFYKYVASFRSTHPTVASIQQILNSFDLLQLDSLVKEFLTDKFNKTANTGGTLHNNACGILYCFAIDYGISITCDLLPSVKRICKGADNTLSAIFGERQIGKYPLLNPILEAMLEYATPLERFALLFAQRFCLRSQHYCHNRKINNDVFIKFKDFHFIPNINNPRAVSITTSHDKNNPQLEHMERVIYCCCNVSKWTCLVHEAQVLFRNNPLAPSDAVVQCKSGDIYYNAMLSIIKKLIKKNWL